MLQSAYDTKQASQDALDSAATTDRAAIRSEFAAADALKADQSTTYSKTEVDALVTAKQDALTDASGLNINSSNVAIGKAVAAGGTRLSVKGHAFFEDSSTTRGLRVHSGKVIEANHAISDAIDLRVHGAGCVRVSQYAGGAVSAVASIGQATTSINSAAIVFSNLPTANPGVSGQLWNDSGVLKIA